MRLLIRLLLLGTAALIGACSEPAGDASSFAGRNVVMIVLDTTRFDHLGMYGYPKGTTPFLDSLAEDAVIFDKAYSGSSWTAPATASIFTSVYPDQHGVISGYFFYQRANVKDPELHLNRLPDELETLPEMMKAAGYRTFCLADNQNICERVGFSRGFDHFVSYSYRGGAELTQEALDWKDELRGGDSPYFLYMQYMDPHKPYHVQEPYYQVEGTVAKGYVKPAARYDSELRYTDELLKNLFEELEIGPNTLVIVTADHGEEFGDHGQTGHDQGLHEELVHVPFFIVGRNAAGELDFEPGRVSRHVSTLDVMPTLRELLDRPAAEFAEGFSVADALRGARTEPKGAERPVFSHRASEMVGKKREFYSVNMGPWQLIYNPETGARQLFNVEKDPGTQHDLSRARPKVFERLLAELDGFRYRPIVFERQYADPVILDQEAQDELGRLGYSE